MKNRSKRAVAVLLLCTILMSMVPFASAEGKMMTTSKQQSAIAMLNYLTVLSQEINASANSRLYLDNVYDAIENNLNPNALDSDSLAQAQKLLDTIHGYQNIETRRERLQYIYEQNQAKAIQKAIPNPVSVLNLVQSGSPAKALISVVFMAVDAKNSYDAYVSETESKYMQDGWVLDDAAAKNLHESRSDAFGYMVEMCQNNDLDGKFALNNNSVKEFVTWEKQTNVKRRIDFFEKNQSTYEAYGKYWLVLAESYYENGAYKKCLSALDHYEGMNINIFRKDHDLAKAVVIGLAAAGEIKKDEEYIELAKHYLEIIKANIETNDWALRYVAAQTYADLYSRTSNTVFLKDAYECAKENVNYLMNYQIEKNKEYLEEPKKQDIGKSDSDKTKKEKKAYNKWLEEEREKELPPAYQPLVVNCQLLFSVAEELGISKEKKADIDGMLHDKGAMLFYNSQLDNKFRFSEKKDLTAASISFNGKKIEIPASLLEQDTAVRVTVTSDGKDTLFEDWTLSKVERGKETSVDHFIAEYESKSIKKAEFSDGDKVTVELVPAKESVCEPVTYFFKVSVTKRLKTLSDTKFILEN